jgi:hypothetical protein
MLVANSARLGLGAKDPPARIDFLMRLLVLGR